MQGGMPEGFRNYNTLFNFSTAQQLTFNYVSLNASILAPLATVQGGSGVVDGNVIVNNWNSSIYIANNRSFQAAGLPAQVISAQASAMARSVAAANPYATVISQATPADTTSNSTITATNLQTVSSSSAIVIPAGVMSGNATSTNNTTTTDADSDLAMAALLAGLGTTLDSALQAQMDGALNDIT